MDHTSDTNGQNYKYESSYEACAKVIKKVVSAYTPALEDFYRRILFNYLIGNGDAHLKNFSLYREPGRKDWSLTPNYDLLFTRYHISAELGYMALDLFSDDIETAAYEAMGYYTLEDFEQFADILGIREKRLQKIFEFILGKTPDVMEMINKSFLSAEGKKQYKINYLERLKLHVCYSIDSFPFKGTTQLEIDKYMPMIEKFFQDNG